MNLYTYTANNPIRYTDPSGHCFTEWLGKSACQKAWNATKNYANETLQDLKDVHSSWESALSYWSLGMSDPFYTASRNSITTEAYWLAQLEIALNTATLGVGKIGTKAATALSKDLMSVVADDIAMAATNNAKASTLVLGKIGTYEKYGKDKGLTYFLVGNDTWDKLYQTFGNDIWSINQKFLEQQISAGKSIILTNNPNGATGFFAKEIDYLKSAGYKFIQNGDIWNATKK